MNYASQMIVALTLTTSLMIQAGTSTEVPDLTPVFESFAKKVETAKKNRNEIQLNQATRDFHQEIDKYQGKTVRCKFATSLIKPHRVTLDNPILGSKRAYRFAFFSRDARSIANLRDLDLEAAADQVIVAGATQPIPFNQRLASITEKTAGNLGRNSIVEIRGTLQPRKVDSYETNWLILTNARVVEP